MDIITTGVITLITTFLGYWFGSRKTNAETDKIVIENVKEILGVYSSTINDLKVEIRELKTKIDDYEKQIDRMSIELYNFRKQMEK